MRPTRGPYQESLRPVHDVGARLGMFRPGKMAKLCE